MKWNEEKSWAYIYAYSRFWQFTKRSLALKHEANGFTRNFRYQSGVI